MMAFTLFSPGPRAEFRQALEVDEATWLRGRAIALAAGLTAYTAYVATNFQIRAATTRQILAAVEGSSAEARIRSWSTSGSTSVIMR